MRGVIHPSNGSDGDAGLYTWDLQTDMFYADSALARLFGLEITQAEHGMPLSRYLDRVCDVDRPALAGAIRHAILTGEPFHESYRVHNSVGALVQILDFARCFRDADDNPRYYAGIVLPIGEGSVQEGDLLWQCMAALEIARCKGREDVAAALVQAIRRLNGNDALATVELVS